jgi:hypothetical protein
MSSRCQAARSSAQTRSHGPWGECALAALLLFAFLPTLTFLGHWDEIFLDSALGSNRVYAPPDAASILSRTAQQADDEQHEQHCHTNLGSCSEQPMPAGIGLLAIHDALLPAAPLASTLVFAAAAQTLPEPPLLTLTPPPRSA